jgi:hypothetical protein
MSATTLKVKAVCLLLLLAGHEALRVNGAARTTLAVTKSLEVAQSLPKSDAENRWNEASERCTWKVSKPGCSGEGCQFRPLPLDTSLSEMCRLSDAYMLSNASTQHQFVELAAQVLEQKSENFKKDCADPKLWQVSKQLHCHRRAGRMMRSAELLSKAAQVSGEQDQNQQHAERALENIASAFGTDGQYLLLYKSKVKGDVLNICKDPIGKFGKMISTVSKLLSGSEDAKNEARRSIEKMPSKNLTKATKRDEKQIKRTTEKLAREYNLNGEEQVEKAWSDLDQFITSETKTTQASSLLQAEDHVSPVGVGILAFSIIVIVVLLIVMLVLHPLHVIAATGAVIGGIYAFFAVSWPVLVPLLFLIMVVMLVRFFVRAVAR